MMPPSTTTKQHKPRKATKAGSRTKSAFEASLPPRHIQDGTDSDSDVDMGEGENDNETVNDTRHKPPTTTSKVVPEKDETEKKLESLLFGDDDGFHEAVKTQQESGMMELVVQQSRGADDASGDEDQTGLGEDDDDDDLANVADADLFFLDSGPGPVPTDLLETPATPSDGDKEQDEDDVIPAVWHDSDDERLTVSLANQPRLRKLRVTESEDLISGKEYIRRLRRQFQRLHPLPDWANPEVAAKRRRRALSAGSDGSTNGADAMDTDADDDSDDDDLSAQPLAKLLQNVGDLTKLVPTVQADGKRKLRQEVLDIQRLKDIGGSQPSAVDSLNFHPHYPLLLSSGPAATLFLHHVSPSAPAPNPLLTSLHIRRTPIHTSAFAPPTGNKIFAAGRRRYFHIWDLDTGKVDKVNGTGDRKEEQKSMERFKLSPCGRYIGLVGTSRKGGGLINILDAGTAQWIAQVRVDGRGGVADFAWWSDGEGLTVVSKNGEVSEYDCRLRRVVARWVDEGAVGTTVLSLGGRSGRAQLGGDRWVAIGSSSGIVNIYDRREWAAAYQTPGAASSSDKTTSGSGIIPRNPKPVRALDQLTTPISHLVFAPDGQMLVVVSLWKRDAMRLVHLPSCTVYRNWPTSNTPLGRISSVAISPNSDMLAVGNEQGRIRLWEIRG